MSVPKKSSNFAYAKVCKKGTRREYEKNEERDRRVKKETDKYKERVRKVQGERQTVITFSVQDIGMPVLDEGKVRQWIRAVAAGYGFGVGEINYIFCSDERELEINRQFLGHDYYTDIITFDYSSAGKVSGDIFISLDTVRSNAGDVGTTFEDELHRVIIHGVLHLTGQEDKSTEARAEMTRKEDKALAMMAKH